MRKKILALLMMAVLICGSLAACSSDKGSDETTAEETETEEAAAFSWEGVDIFDYIKLGEYKGVTYTIKEVEVTDEQVDSQIETILASNATVEQITEGTDEEITVKDDSVANIAYEGKIDGETFSGGSSESYDLDIANNSFIEGFADGVVGMKVGESKDLDLQFPSDYWSEDYAGKDVVFTVTVNYLQGDTIEQELTEDFISEYTGGECTTEEEFRQSIYDDLYQSAQTSAEQTMQQEVWLKIMEDSEVISYPEGLVEEYYNSQLEELDYYAQMYGITIDELLTEQLGYETADAAKEVIMQSAEKSALSEMVYKAIFATEKMELTDEELTEGAESLAVQYGYDSGSALITQIGEEPVRESLSWQKTLDFVMENAVGVEAEEEETTTKTTSETTMEETADSTAEEASNESEMTSAESSEETTAE